MQRVAVADHAFLTGCIRHVQIAPSHEHMRTAVAQQARNSAGAGVNILLLGVLCRLGVFQRQLVFHFVGDQLFYVRGKYRLPAFRAGRVTFLLACCLIRSVSGLQVLRDDIVGQPKRGRGVHRIRLEIVAEVPIPGIACPSPSEGNRRRPRIVRPSVKARGKVEARSINTQRQPAEPIAAVEAVIFPAMVVVRPSAKIVAVVMIASFHISAAAPLGNNAAAVMALGRYSPPATHVVMNIHPPLGVMHVAHLAVGSGSHRAAALGDARIASLGRNTPGRRVAETGGVRASAGRHGVCARSAGGRSVRGGPAGARSMAAYAARRWPVRCPPPGTPRLWWRLVLNSGSFCDRFLRRRGLGRGACAGYAAQPQEQDKNRCCGDISHGTAKN